MFIFAAHITAGETAGAVARARWAEQCGESCAIMSARWAEQCAAVLSAGWAEERSEASVLPHLYHRY